MPPPKQNQICQIAGHGAFIDLNEQKRHKLTAAQIAKRSCERKLS